MLEQLLASHGFEQDRNWFNTLTLVVSCIQFEICLKGWRKTFQLFEFYKQSVFDSLCPFP